MSSVNSNIKVIQKGLHTFLENTKNAKFTVVQKRVVSQGFDLLGDELKKKEESHLKSTIEFVENGFKDLVKSKDDIGSETIRMNYNSSSDRTLDDDDNDDDGEKDV